MHAREREREAVLGQQCYASFSSSVFIREVVHGRESSRIYILLSALILRKNDGTRGPSASITDAANERSGLLETPNATKEEENLEHRNSSSLLKKIAKARTKVNLPSAIGGFAVGVKFGFVLLLLVLVRLPRERFDSLRTNLGEFLPISLSKRVISPESSYKREHGMVAN